MRRLAVVLVSAAVLVLGACSSSSTKSSSSTATSSSEAITDPAASDATASDSAAASSGAVPTSPNQLAALLITKVPSGFVAQPDSVGDTGPSDLAKAVKDDGSPDAEKALRSEGFTRGYQRLWLDSSKAQIIVFLYQFDTPAGAKQDWSRGQANFATQVPPGATSFAVQGLPADASAGVIASKGAVTAAIVDFSVGVYNVRVVCSGAATAGLQDRASALALDQYQRLLAGAPTGGI